MSLLAQLKESQINAMRSKDKLSLGTIRMALAAVKQREVDERIELTDTDVLQILTKMVKQRQEAAALFISGSRQDLADREEAEILVIKRFLPSPLSDKDIQVLIDDAVAKSGAVDIKDMGKVMAILKPQVQGRADMGDVSKLIKAKLG